MTRPTEDQVRLVRQYLLAREEGRREDAAAIWEHLGAAGLRLSYVRACDVARSYLEYWQVPGSVEEFVVLDECGREPVFRIPHDNRTRRPSRFEVPKVVPGSLSGAVRSFEGVPLIELPAPGRIEALRRRLWR